MKKTLDPSLLLDFFPRWKIARESKSKSEISALVDSLERLTGLSTATIYRKFERWLKGQSIFDVAQNKNIQKKISITKQIEKQKRKEVALKVSGLQRASQKGKRVKQISVARAVRILVRIGQLESKYLDIDNSTVTRWQNEFNLSMKDFMKHQPQNRIAFDMRDSYEFANQVFSVDASVLDKYFLNLNSGKFSTRPIYLPKGDNHEQDYLNKNGLVKIWVYYALDCYSGAYWLKAYIPYKSESAKYGGENSVDMRDFLIECFLNKSQLEISSNAKSIFGESAKHLMNAPLQGIPEWVYSDNGSPCNTALKPFLTNLGIKVKTHHHTNPRAKPIEAKISATKKVIESQLNLLTDKQIGSVEVLNYILQAAAYNDCHQKKYYQKYLQSALQKPIQTVSLFDLQNAQIIERQRTINNYGMVSVQWKANTKSFEYVVGKPGDNIHPGEKVYVYKNIHGEVFARNLQTLEIVKCVDKADVQASPFGKRERIEASNIVQLHKEADVIGEQLKRSLTITDVVDPIEQMLVMPAKNTPAQITPIVPPPEFDSVEQAKEYIVFSTGISFNLMSENLYKIVTHSLELEFANLGYIRDEMVLALNKKVLDLTKISKQNLGG